MGRFRRALRDNAVPLALLAPAVLVILLVVAVTQLARVPGRRSAAAPVPAQPEPEPAPAPVPALDSDFAPQRQPEPEI